MATEIKTKFYKIVVNKKGRRVLITSKKILADALAFTTELKVYIFDDADGKRVFSIECDERVQRIAEMICQWHDEAMDMKRKREEQSK